MSETLTLEAMTTTGERFEFAPEVIKKRGFIRAKYWSWDDYRNGLITFAGKTFLRVLFQTGISLATSYYTVKIEEVQRGLWDITFTPDLEHFYRVDGGKVEEDIDLIAGVKKLFREE